LLAVAPVRGQLHRAATDIDEPEVRAAVRPVLTAAQQPNTQQQQQQQQQLSEDKLINKGLTYLKTRIAPVNEALDILYVYTL